MRSKNYKKAFTLVELIIGLAVMGTIASFSTMSYVGYTEMADREKGKLDIQQVKNAVDNYQLAHQKYPTIPEGKQPTPDVRDVNGNLIEGYSQVDVKKLVDERYLQAIPELGKGEFFAVNYNGVVSVKDGISESIVIDNGNIFVDKQINDKVPIKVYTGPNCSSIKLFETNNTYSVSGSGQELIGASGTIVSSKDGYSIYDGLVKVSDKPGQKYLVARIKYSNGKSSELRASFQYTVMSEAMMEDIYWVNRTVDQTTDAGKATDEKLIEGVEYFKQGTDIRLNWTDKELASGASAIKYEIHKFIDVNGKEVDAPDSPIIVGGTEYIDKAVNDSNNYRYKIYAYSAAKNEDGSNKKTRNALVTSIVKPNAYKDTPSYIDNITKNDFNTAHNKMVSVRAADIDNGIMKVFIGVAQFKGTLITNPNDFKEYEMYVTPDGTTTEIIAGKPTNADVYSATVDVLDEYMVYYIKVIDGKGNITYNYMDPNMKKEPNETDLQFEKRRHVVSKKFPSNDQLQNSCYTLMRGLVEIFNDTYVDETKINKTVSNYHIFDGKITLP